LIMALTDAKLNDADKAIDDIIEFSTSDQLTMVDSITGVEKPTLLGVVEALDAQANVTQVMTTKADTQALRDEVQTLHDEAQGTLDAIEDMAFDAQATLRTYTTTALAEPAVGAGLRYFLRQTTDRGLWEMERTATGSKLIGPRLSGAKGRQLEYRRALRGTLPPDVPGALFNIVPSDGWEWGGRVLPNRLASVLPTLNWLPDPFNPLDELGGTPAREPNTLVTADPLGGNNALKLTATGQAQYNTWYRGGNQVYTATDLRARIKTYGVGGTSQWRLGEASGSTGLLVNTPVNAWDAAPSERVIPGFTGAVDLGFGSATGNVAGVAAVFNAQLYDSVAGESATLPTDAQELAAQKAGHMKRDLSGPGAFPINEDGTLAMNGTTQGAAMITVDPSGVVLSQGYTFGVLCDFTDETAEVDAIAMGFDRHAAIANGANGISHGQVGMYGPGTAYRIGKLFCNPTLSSLAGTPAPMYYLPKQGLTFLGMRVTPNPDGVTATQHFIVNEISYLMTKIGRASCRERV